MTTMRRLDRSGGDSGNGQGGDATKPGGGTAGMASRLGKILAGGAAIDRCRDIDIPRLGPAKLRLLRRREEEAVDVALASWAQKVAEERGASVDALIATGIMPLAKRRVHETLAIAVRDPDDPDKPFGTLEEWAELDDDLLGELNVAYEDLREENDPIARPLTDAQVEEIWAAIGKKNWNLLCACGARMLVSFLRTTGVRRPTSASPSASPGDSPPM